MDVRTPRVFQFDALEERVCLSTYHAGALHGSVMKGSIEVPVSPATTLSSALSIEGNGNVSPLGPVSALGTLNPNEGGVLDLASGDGGIVVNLGGTARHGRAGKPRVHFTINGGTGTFTHASGHGTIDERPGHGMLALQFHGSLRTGA